ncbi:hypothetical protein [Corallococcus sp. CA047B]|uniref:hypothetical protein n=1 Tax=Corallococcus sp. CA047B TaxID=2316729 RepID=UPI0011C47939|nr:hypothetical protein [Corallococcus sp. CA047B]
MNSEPMSRTVKRLGLTLLVCWFVPSTCVAVSLGSVGALQALTAEPTSIPGDPPIDILLGGALCGWLFILIGFCGFFVARHEADPIVRLWRRVLPPLTVLSLLALSPTVAQVGGRHFGEWRRLKSLLRENEARVQQMIGRTEGSLSEEESALVRAWFLEHPVSLRFESEPEPVRIRLMHSTPPYVGVDFGRGRNAVFDPVTMLCLYSD